MQLFALADKDTLLLSGSAWAGRAMAEAWQG
jgi:hypothetical protein